MVLHSDNTPVNKLVTSILRYIYQFVWNVLDGPIQISIVLNLHVYTFLATVGSFVWEVTNKYFYGKWGVNEVSLSDTNIEVLKIF